MEPVDRLNKQINKACINYIENSIIFNLKMIIIPLIDDWGGTREKIEDKIPIDLHLTTCNVEQILYLIITKPTIYTITTATVTNFTAISSYTTSYTT